MSGLREEETHQIVLPDPTSRKIAPPLRREGVSRLALSLPVLLLLLVRLLPLPRRRSPDDVSSDLSHLVARDGAG